MERTTASLSFKMKPSEKALFLKKIHALGIKPSEFFRHAALNLIYPERTKKIEDLHIFPVSKEMLSEKGKRMLEASEDSEQHIAKNADEMFKKAGL